MIMVQNERVEQDGLRRTPMQPAEVETHGVGSQTWLRPVYQLRSGR